MKNEFVVVEVFAGAGGLGTGFEMAGLSPAIAVEIDPIASATYQLNHPETIVWCKDIKDVTGQAIRDVIGNKKVILIGGPPCQSWSEMQEDIRGSRQGLDDPRGQLLYEYLRICEELQPEFIVFENVSYLVSEKHLPAFSEFKVKLQNRTGLSLEYRVLNALDYGVAQLRERVIMIGAKVGVSNPFEHLAPIDGPKTLREQLHGCPESEYAAFTPYEASVMSRIPAGKCWNVLSPSVAAKAMGRDYRGVCNVCGAKTTSDKCGCGSTSIRNGSGITSYFRRLSWERPSYTVCTVSPTKAHGTLAHPDENRGLSFRECARLQGFPDDYVFTGTLKDKYRQIGNAVAVTMGLAIGRAVLNTIEIMPVSDAADWVERFVDHPAKGTLSLLERDFLNSVYVKIKSGCPVPPRHLLYLEDTYRRLNGGLDSNEGNLHEKPCA